ncbi:MAG: TatD family hydrolase [Chlorobi bacterium]|nr:TatD family hydrolase [Chlorobiota bacterium]
MIDTHAHLFLPEFAKDLDEVVRRAKQTGITKILLPNIDETTIDPLHQTVKLYPEYFYPMMGLHPLSIKDNWHDQLAIIKTHLDKQQYVAVGEVGLDFYRDYGMPRNVQEQVLETQLEWALEKGLPVSLHTRNAIDRTIEIVSQYAKKGLKGVFHCFTGTYDQARKILDLGFYLGIGGVITFPKVKLGEEVIKKVGLDGIVLETDAPYLAPQPRRGRRNESAYLKYVAEFLAKLLNIPVEKVDAITTQNALNLFPLPPTDDIGQDT